MFSASQSARDRYARRNEDEELRRAFALLDRDGDGKISPADVSAYLLSMGHEISKREVEDMIWEHDEDCDGKISFEEFLEMYARCRNDSEGNEPRLLYDVVLFAIHAKESGVIPIEEAIKMTHLRVGLEACDSSFRSLYGEPDIRSGKVITLSEYVSCHQKQMLLEFSKKSKR